MGRKDPAQTLKKKTVFTNQFMLTALPEDSLVL